MVTFVVALALAFGVSTLLTPAVRSVALRYGLFDAVNARKVHATPIPRLGGVAIVAGFYGPLVGLWIYRNGIAQLFYKNPNQVLGFFAGGLAIAALGLYDDLRGADAKVKFTVQFGVALAMYRLGFQVHGVANPFGSAIDLGVLAIPFTLLWIVGVINAMNLIDGLDGLASGVAFFAVIMNFTVALANGDVLMALLMAALAGAILGFLLFNFNPASIFMGDTGSMFLGFILATSSLVTSHKGAAAVSMMVPVLALGLPIMDTLLAMARRFVLARPIFSADRDHMHHKLLKQGFTHRRAVLTMYGLCVFFTLAGLSITYANGPQAAAILAAVGVVVFFVVRKLGYLDMTRAGSVADVRRKNIVLRATVNDIGEALRNAAAPEQIWSCVRQIGEPLGMGGLSLSLQAAALGEGQHRFEVTLTESRAVPFELAVPVELAGAPCGELRARWLDGRHEAGRDDELALELLADHVGRALQRVTQKPEPTSGGDGGPQLRVVR